jgi:cystathionine beta-lyase
MKFSTLVVHAGQEPDSQTGAVNTPVSFTSTFVQDGIGILRNGFEYARTDNPSRRALETTLAALEGGQQALAFASGQAASTAVLQLLESGDEVITTLNVYGGTYRLFHKIFNRFGIKITVVDESTPEAICAVCSERTAMIWAESPSNPLLTLLDIGEVSSRLESFRNRKGVKPLLVIDNTFPSPAFQNPLLFGADIVAHSCTKYICGHSDVVSGCLIVNDAKLGEQLKFIQNATGAVPSPMDCYLLQRGIRTLSIRMKKHEENAYAVAEFLRAHPDVERVYFPGFKDHADNKIVQKQMRGVSGMVSFRLRGDFERVKKFCASFRLIFLAESLGGVESLVCHPASMTHAAFSKTDREKIGITDNLIRLSLGIEDADDLIDDLKTAFKLVKKI